MGRRGEGARVREVPRARGSLDVLLSWLAMLSILGCSSIPVIPARSGAGGSACSVGSSSSSSTGGLPADPTMFGDESRIALQVSVTIQSMPMDSAPSTYVSVAVLDALHPLDGVVVSGAANGAPLAFGNPLDPSVFEPNPTSEVQSVDLLMNSPLGSRTGMHFVGRSPTLATYDPPISIGTATTATWTPAEPHIAVSSRRHLCQPV